MIATLFCSETKGLTALDNSLVLKSFGTEEILENIIVVVSNKRNLDSFTLSKTNERIVINFLGSNVQVT